MLNEKENDRLSQNSEALIAFNEKLNGNGIKVYEGPKEERKHSDKYYIAFSEETSGFASYDIINKKFMFTKFEDIGTEDSKLTNDQEQFIIDNKFFDVPVFNELRWWNRTFSPNPAKALLIAIREYGRGVSGLGWIGYNKDEIFDLAEIRMRELLQDPNAKNTPISVMIPLTLGTLQKPKECQYAEFLKGNYVFACLNVEFQVIESNLVDSTPELLAEAIYRNRNPKLCFD